MPSKKGTSLPNSGTLFPCGLQNELEEVEYAQMVATALQNQFRRARYATKTVMGWTGATDRTVKNWFAGTKGPNGVHLIVLARHSDDVFAGLLRLTGRQAPILDRDLFEVRQKIRNMLALVDQVAGPDESGARANGNGSA